MKILKNLYDKEDKMDLSKVKKGDILLYSTKDDAKIRSYKVYETFKEYIHLGCTWRHKDEVIPIGVLPREEEVKYNRKGNDKNKKETKCPLMILGHFFGGIDAINLLCRNDCAWHLPNEQMCALKAIAYNTDDDS